MQPLVFLLDVDNTLLDNDAIKKDWDEQLQVELGPIPAVAHFGSWWRSQEAHLGGWLHQPLKGRSASLFWHFSS